MRQICTILILLISLSIPAQTINEPSPIEWDGYTQLRFTSNLGTVNRFSVRRMKLWINSAPGLSEHWGFHIQANYKSYPNEIFSLQDVLVYYQNGRFRLNMGQFIPHYSLEQFQRDFFLPLTERAEVIISLIPNGTLGLRDIGLEANYISRNECFKSWLGLFNGSGIKEYRLKNFGILLTHKTEFTLPERHFSAGYSVMYRKADQLKLQNILPDTTRFTGNDLRYNLYTKYSTKRTEIQAEYLLASLNGTTASGWYLLAHVNIGKNQLAVSWNQYTDLISETNSFPEVHLGYNYKINGDNLKLMLDNKINVAKGELKNYFVTIQLQLSFN
ncbi:hypothetical protein ACE01N_00940 [Saccharicrinis sp. FJH2]|uniref:hypothetical protein n=1 Tax=Saccharicrinis sp. FJH65 TaxID=3344659 RepID=UPI0035F4FC83